jgi:hypothetical protein
MKNSFKITAFLFALTGIAFGAKAQTTPSTTASNGVIYSVGVEGGYATSSIRNFNKWSLGGSIQADIPTSKDLFLTVNAGYDNIFGRNNVLGTAGSANDINLLPVTAGLKYFPFSKFYVQGSAGAAFALNKHEVGFDRSAAFVYAPEVGVQLPLGGKNFIDAGVRYQGSTLYTSDVSASKVNFIGLRVAYAFGL